MRTPRRLGSLVLAAFTGWAAPGCFRSPAKIPPPGEGAFVSGVVVARDLTSAEVAGVEGATVTSVGSSKSTLTDKRGFFQLQRLPLGRIRIFIEKPAALSTPALRRILDPIEVLVDGQIVDEGQVELSGAGDLSGSVALSPGGGAGGLVSGAGALIVATETVFKAIAGEDGRYLIAGLPEGSVDLVVLRDGYAPAHVFGVRVSPGATVQVKDVVLEPGPPKSVDVSGSAKLEDASDHSGISVTFTDERDAQKIGGTAMTGADGAFHVTLATGVYRARFTKDGYCTGEVPNVGVLPEGVLGLGAVALARVAAGGASGDVCMATLPPPGFDGGVPTGTPDGGFPHAPPPHIDTIEPTSGPIGTTVLIHGRNFVPDPADITVRFGRSGPFVGAESASSSLVTVVVPDGAMTGTVSLYSSRGSTTSSQIFEVTPGPSIFDFAPKTARVSSTVEVVGKHFIAEGLHLFVEGTPAGHPGEIEATVLTAASGGPEIDTVIIGLEEYQRVRFTVPSGAAAGSIHLRTAHGDARSAAPLTVAQGPEITGIIPNPAPRGATILIIGTGFSTADTGGQVAVAFTGVATPATPLSVNDTGIRVVVPDTAMNGPITVLHPAGNAVSPASIQLIVDAMAPVITSIQPTLIKADGMHALTIAGHNLQGTTMVHFAGGVSAAPTNATSGQVLVNVPAGALPGAVTIDLDQPTMTSTGSRQRLRIVKVTAGPQGAYFGGGFSPSGDVIYAMAYGTGYVVDPDTLRPAVGVMPVVVQVPSGTRDFFFQVAPNGRIGLYGTTNNTGLQAQLYFLDLPSFQVMGMCSPPEAPFVTMNYRQGLHFDAASTFAYGTRPDTLNGTMQDGVFRADLVRYTCDVILPRTLSGNQIPYVGLQPGELLGTLVVADSIQGLALYNVDPMSPSQGTMIMPFTGMPLQNYNELFWGPGYRYLYAVSNAVKRMTPFTSAPIENVAAYDGTAIPGFEAIQSSDQRWMIAPGYVVDLEAGIGVWAEPGLSPGSGIGAVHPTKNIFVVAIGSGFFSRVDIIE